MAQPNPQHQLAAQLAVMTEKYQQMSSQLTDLLSQNQRLTAQLSDLVQENKQLKAQQSNNPATTETTPPMDSNRQFTFHPSDKISKYHQRLLTQVIPGYLLPQRRHFMSLPALSCTDDPESWIDVLKVSLARYDLCRHLQEDISEPEDEMERQKWKNDRVDIIELMVESIKDTGLIGCIKRLGWTANDCSPKATFEIIVLASADKYDEVVELVSRFRILRNSMDAKPFFRTLVELRDNFCKEKFHGNEFNVNDGKILSGLLFCLRASLHFRVYSRAISRLAAGSLTWHSLFEEVAEDALLHQYRSMSFDLFDPVDNKDKELRALMASILERRFSGGRGIFEVRNLLLTEAYAEGRIESFARPLGTAS